MQNLHRRFVLCSNGQIYGGDFAKLCGLLRIYELYITDGAAKTFGKIEQKNMPEIDRLLGKLNVTLATFIMDPGILFTFFGDPEKAQIMMEVE